MTDHSGPTGRPSVESDAPTGQLRTPSGLSIEVVGLTDKGRVRPGNEDNLIFEEPQSAQARTQGTLLVVSDGMGGHAAGEVASKIAVETVHAVYYRNRGMPPDAAMHDAITRANAAIFEAAQQRREQAGMGCTVVALAVQGADLTIGHVGDSRAYLIRGGRATQLTLDHSWVAMQVHEGILTPEQAEHHPNRSVLMRALGRQASVEIDIGHRQLQPGDIVLLCSDGLTGMVTDAEIAEYAGRLSPQALPSALVDLANQRGAPDNVTVLIGAVRGALGAARATTAASAVDPNTTTTVIAAPQDARTPRLDAPDGDTPTDRSLRRAADATMPMGVTGAASAAAAGAAATPAVSPTTSASAGQPQGRPVVVSRSSVTRTDAQPGRRRGRGRWIAGAVAAFGLAGALVLISIFQLTRDGTPTQSVASATSTPVPAAAPAVVATAPAPVPTVPPPISSQLPGLTTPPGSGPQTGAPAAPAVPATQPTAPPAPTAASSPAAATATPNPLLPSAPTLVPTLQSIFATAIPTLSGGPRTSEAPATSSDGPAAPSGTDGGSASGAGASGNPGGGAPSGSAPSGGAATTTEPSTDTAPPADPAPETATEPAPEPEPSGVAPVPPADSAQGSSSDLCARGSALAPGLAARAGCRPSNNNDSGR